MTAMYKGRWIVALALAAASVGFAGASIAVIASPAFTESTESLVRIVLIGVVPALAILAIATATQASSRILRTPWAAAILGVLGAGATSLACEQWYARVEDAQGSAAPLIVAVGAAVALNGSAIAALGLPAVSELPLPAGIAILALLALFGGAAVLLFAFPAGTTVVVAVTSLVVVVMMWRSERAAHVAAVSG